ncbi:ABC transporter permease [Gordonia aichiensis]|uniref:Putative ABC transporter permease protein n=1 Tax=Gordonia aichiensis NBRC 108223 TaxID=1220583 RepID=L7KIV4_9ACTN|nr:ABC transporter permease [Gordonia aichiensis]GAC48815.1 putative ABC transporter permease protein [Gordonia aichiensis NBRC 108223]
MTSHDPNHATAVHGASAMQSIRLVAQREIVTRAKTRSFILSTVALMLVIVVGLIIWKAISGGGTDPERVGLAGDSSLSTTITQLGDASGTPITVVSIDSGPDALSQARSGVESGDLDAAVVRGSGESYDIVSKTGLSDTMSGVLRGSIQQHELSQGLAARGVDAASLPTPTITSVQTTPDKPDKTQRIVIALVGAILLVTAIMLGGNMIAVGVVEEKTSRIVELLLATVKPLHLMWGKILGIGAVALGQVVILGLTALIAGLATGMLTIAGTAVWMFLAVLVWFLLGYLFFATLYAAAGALVSRQEELGSTIMPLTVLSMAVMYAGIFGVQSLQSTFIEVLTWIPPFSAVLMPIRIATGDTNAMQIVITLILMLLACAAATWFAARIYQQSILRTGSRVKWSEVLSMAR